MITSAHRFSTGAAWAAGATAAHQLVVLAAGVTDTLQARRHEPIGPHEARDVARGALTVLLALRDA